MPHKSKSHRHHDRSGKRAAGSPRRSRRRSPSPRDNGADDSKYDSDWTPELQQAVSADIQECLELRNKLLNVVVADSVEEEKQSEENEWKKSREKEHKRRSVKQNEDLRKHKDRSGERKHRSKESKKSKGVAVQVPRTFHPHVISDNGKIIVVDQTGEYGTGLDFNSRAKRNTTYSQRERPNVFDTSMDRTSQSALKSNHREENAERHVAFNVKSSSNSSNWSVSELSTKRSDSPISNESDGSWTAAMKTLPDTKLWFKEDEEDEEDIKKAQSSGFTWSVLPADSTIPPNIPHPVEELTRRSTRTASSAGITKPPKVHCPTEASSSGSTWPIPSTSITNLAKVHHPVKAPKDDWTDSWTSTTDSYCTSSESSSVTNSYQSRYSPTRSDSTWDISSTTASVGSEDERDTIVPFSWRRKLEDESIYSNAGSSNPPEPSDADSEASWGDSTEKNEGYQKKGSGWRTIPSPPETPYDEDGWDSQSSWGSSIKRSQSSTPSSYKTADGEKGSDSEDSWGGEVKQKPRSPTSPFSNYKAPYVEDASDSIDKKKTRKYGHLEDYSTPKSWRDV
ncbi:hypothetical protein DM02DRAFT_393876 [Periconia macrospinosa]|uniref:Uncharacterized protein n=1 Tax=Periconia macrospinosa TaxID=97972 RepID=A0A2V1DQS5_9PLEO|nr:hypothetical protein DM02DRAFT_393876 [Periconia macrospinosa]